MAVSQFSISNEILFEGEGTNTPRNGEKVGGPHEETGSKASASACVGDTLSLNSEEPPIIQAPGNHISDPAIGKSCHQCRQRIKEFPASCKNQQLYRPCPLVYCHKCLMNRYGKRVEEIAALENWNCPKCRGICNCSVCMKRRGEKPTGNLLHRARSSGYSCVMALLLSEQKEEALTLLSESGGKLMDKETESSSSSEMMDTMDNEGLDQIIHPENVDRVLADFQTLSQLPCGIEKSTVADINMREEDVGNALQFLEFCAAFGKIFNLKEGQANVILRDLMQEGASFTSIGFQMQLLSTLEADSGGDLEEVCRKVGMYCSPNSKAYESVENSEKLRLLIHLCDEILGTEVVRRWMYEQRMKLDEQRRITNASKKKKRLLGQESMLETMASTSQADINSTIAHVKTPELETCDIRDFMRTEAILFGRSGEAYWKLNCLGKSMILRQEVGDCDLVTVHERWFDLNEEDEKAIEKVASSLKGKRSRRRPMGADW